MPLTSDRSKLQVLLLLGCSLGAVGGAFTAMGIPASPPLAQPVEMGANGPLALPVVESLPPVRIQEPAGTGRRLEQRSLTPAALAGRLSGPQGYLANTLVEMVALPLPGRPDRAAISVLTDQDGRFSMRRLPARHRDWALRIKAPGYGSMVLPLAGEGRPWPGELRLAYSRWVTGRVLDPAGRPVAGARIMLGQRVRDSHLLYSLVATSGQDGSFTARDLPVDREVVLLADHPVHAPGRTQSLVLGLEADLPAQECFLEQGLELVGRLFQRNGAPAGGIQVQWEKIHAGGARVQRSAVTDKGGQFKLVGLPHRYDRNSFWVSSPRGRRHRVSLRFSRQGWTARLPW